jgi:hypothetical protein
MQRLQITRYIHSYFSKCQHSDYSLEEPTDTKPIHSSNSLRKTQTSSNSEKKIDSKGRVTIMDARIRNPYLENPARARELDGIPPSRKKKCGASTTTGAKNQNASMARVTGSRGV